MTIYTSYFANRALKSMNSALLHAISVGLPKDLQCDRIRELTPDWNTVSAYKDGKIDWAEYSRQYYAKLDALGVNKVLSLLEDGHVYLCFEGKNKNCHRHLLAEWLRINADITVTEI